MDEREKTILRRICPQCHKRYKTDGHVIATITELKEKGYSYREIAGLAHLSHSTVARYWKYYLLHKSSLSIKKKSVWRRFINFVKFWKR